MTDKYQRYTFYLKLHLWKCIKNSKYFKILHKAETRIKFKIHIIMKLNCNAMLQDKIIIR